MQNNVSHLSEVLVQIGLTSRDLAEILNVHYSLVSKWINNKRPLRYNSLHLKNLVNALLSIDNPHKNATLKSILRESYPGADLSEKEKVAVYLSSYLASDSRQSSEKNLLDDIYPGCVYARAKIDIYRKNSGRRDALMRMLNTAIALAPDQELLLFSEENLSWHIEDENFRKFWIEKHRDNILRFGNRVTMVHTVDRQMPHLLHTITQWLPLHLTGKTTALYHPEYSNSIFKPSLSILRGHSVMVGMTADGFSDMLYTYYSSDPHMVRQFESLFTGLLAGCRPLFERLDEDNITQNMLIAAQRKDSSYAFSGLPLKLSLDCEAFSELLLGNGISGERYDRCVDFFQRCREFMLNTMTTCASNQLLDLSVIEQGVRNGIDISEFNWIIGRNLTINAKCFKLGLRGLINLLNEKSNFSLALITDYALPHVRDVSLYIKENTIAVANSRTQGTLSPLIMKEPTIVRTFYQYFERFWGSIPRVQRDKESVIHRLEQLTR
jgi:predicted transcriptional regulator